MITYEKLKEEGVGSWCRNCLNQRYRLNLKRKDCLYLYYPYKCQNCRQVKNIVMAIRFTSRWKLLAGRSE